MQEVRSKRRDKVQDQCGILQLLDISHPIRIDDMYIDVNILQSIASMQRLEVANPKKLEPEAFERFGLGDIEQEQVLGVTAVENYSKVRMLGKPGSGKTTLRNHNLNSRGNWYDFVATSKRTGGAGMAIDLKLQAIL